ncbi:MAG: hypothetical protein K0S73_382 [Stenotrophomonas rhizophila]|jgi:hypothetical protein|nr:hypothetical protein [Stenotrophomonas rhizophila]
MALGISAQRTERLPGVELHAQSSNTSAPTVDGFGITVRSRAGGGPLHPSLAACERGPNVPPSQALPWLGLKPLQNALDRPAPARKLRVDGRSALQNVRAPLLKRAHHSRPRGTGVQDLKPFGRLDHYMRIPKR